MTDWTPTWCDELLVASQQLARFVDVLHSKVATLEVPLGRSLNGLSMEAYADLDALADLLLSAPKVPAKLARQAHDAGASAGERRWSTKISRWLKRWENDVPG